MNTIRFATMLLSAVIVTCNSRPGLSQSNEISNKKIELNEYIVDSCLGSFFHSIANSNDTVYGGEKFFYAVTYQRSNKQHYLKIEPEPLVGSRYGNFVGGCKIGRNFFLFRGDIGDNPLFHAQTNSTITVDISTSSDTMPFIEDPALDGYLNECSGQPIYVEVYTKEGAIGYERWLRRKE